MEIYEVVLLITASFFAGIINSIAGGGSFLTFPALVFAGVPTIAANATSAVAVFPGYLSGALGFAKELKAFPKSKFLLLIFLSISGGVLGSILLLITPEVVFSFIIPWLLGFATLLFAFGNYVSKLAEKTSDKNGFKSNIATLLVCIYGGYFNGGLGIVLLALFSTLGMRDIHLMNGLKNIMSFALSAASVVTFAIAGIVFWKYAIIMMIAATIGGYFGVMVARKLSKSIIRIIIVIIGTIMTFIFFIKT
ncbi:sulfite exporter TauE/SafE family protein [Amylibacter sp.]|nr:sulfite exporter TauE/SafE family protein [Amylibacter sp.]MDA9229976.1 sulfite exporter TauE/SafE family protein [Amylibacter sp.]MDB2472528.1 sulfite exporter TauE/SafE family protein [Amylibacter sp.]MDB4220542.1 sulfite exporter TauE/SafE family protein [Amylibacter sp.]MDB9852552.1 sulfite exporter TauE/SafE family protein [Amylibacter sp.]